MDTSVPPNHPKLCRQFIMVLDCYLYCVPQPASILRMHSTPKHPRGGGKNLGFSSKESVRLAEPIARAFFYIRFPTPDSPSFHAEIQSFIGLKEFSFCELAIRHIPADS